MNITIKTKVEGHFIEVMNRFDLSLFEALKPPMAKMEIVEFTGSQKGDKVHIKFKAPIKSEWISLITDHGQDQSKAYFVDEGHLLPFPLKSWKHIHIVEKIDENSSYIVDDIYYSSYNIIMTILMYPAVYFGFSGRKKVYQSYFSKSNL